MHAEERVSPHPPTGRAFSRIAGYLVEWDKPSEPLQRADGGTYVEIFRKGCFARSVLQVDVPVSLGKGRDAVRVGCKSAGKLKLKEDDVGLWYELAVPAGHQPHALLAAPKARIVFALRNTQSDRWSADKATREILDVDLTEVGLALE